MGAPLSPTGGVALFFAAGVLARRVFDNSLPGCNSGSRVAQIVADMEAHQRIVTAAPRPAKTRAKHRRKAPYSHSIVPGGLLVMSYTTRLTPFTSLMMRVATWPMKAMSKG